MIVSVIDPISSAEIRVLFTPVIDYLEMETMELKSSLWWKM